MKKILNRMRQYLKNRKKRELRAMPDFLLVLLGGPSFLIAGYWGIVLTDVVPDFIRAVNKLGYIDPLISMMGLILLALSGLLWFYTTLAARCHSLLYERWFK